MVPGQMSRRQQPRPDNQLGRLVRGTHAGLSLLFLGGLCLRGLLRNSKCGPPVFVSLPGRLSVSTHFPAAVVAVVAVVGTSPRRRYPGPD